MGESQEHAAPLSVGKYRIIGTLGRGAMGVVYKGQDPEIGRVVAIKVLRSLPASLGADSSAALERFKTEARSAGNLRHPHIITVFEVSSEGAAPFIVMDYIEGEGLDSYIRRRGRLDPAETARILEQVADGLDHAHSKGVVHRDIKPSNILIDRNGDAFVLDFGVASIGEASTTGPVVGSPGYMSPEQILNKEIDYRTDIWSLGVLAFECLTAQRPFPGDNFTVVVSNILNAKPLSLTELRPELPLSAESELETALTKNKEKRPPSSKAFVEALARSLGLKRGAPQAESDVFARPRSRKHSNWMPIGTHGIAETPQQPAPQTAHLPELHAGSAGDDFSRPRSDAQRLPSSAVFDFQGLHRHPGGVFSHATESLVDLADDSDQASTGTRLIIALLGLVCLLMGGLILWLVFGDAGTSRDESNVPDPIVALSPHFPPQQLSGKVDHQEPEPGKPIGEMSDRELLGLLVSQDFGDDQVLKGIEEARRRKLPDLVEALVVLLQSDSYVIRIEALKALGGLGDRRVVPSIVPVLQDHDPLVRSQAARSLMDLGDRKAVAFLQTRLLRENVPDVKLTIRRAIEKLNGYPMSE